jgi:glycosyltransferase involved in cell wall biosynthesis
MDEPWAEVDEAGEWLLVVERQLRPGLIHLNGYAHAALRWQAPVLVTGHSCVRSWWQAVHGGDPPPTWDTYTQRVGRGLHAADVVTAPTTAMLNALEHHYGPLPCTRVIGNGCGTGPIAPAPRRRPLVLTAGRLWDPAKNVEAVCAAASSIDWPVYVAGEHRRPDGGPSAGDAWCGAVHLLGQLPYRDLRALMHTAAIYALPARYEPFGLSALEAGLAGCALVLGDIDSLREVWGDAAIYVPPDDRPALSAALRALIAAPHWRADLGMRARRRAGEFTAARMAEGYLDAYRHLLSLAAV